MRQHGSATTPGVIVYLVQVRHSSYGRNSTSLLQQSVKLLHKNYNAQHRDDVLFLHSGDFGEAEQRSILSECGDAHARFMMLSAHHFQVPAGTPPSTKWHMRDKFSAGYRHMIRLFALDIWGLLASEGYTWMMRMDEDSFLISPIEYNIFQFMQDEGYEYGYRLSAWEYGGPVRARGRPKFHAFVRDFVQTRKLQPKWLMHTCTSRNMDNFSLAACGEIYIPYNNWIVTRLGFWLSDSVQDYLRHINSSHNIYTERWGDHMIHATALQIFLDRARVHMFTDFAYEHTRCTSTQSTEPWCVESACTGEALHWAIHPIQSRLRGCARS